MLTIIIPALNEEDRVHKTVENVIRSAKAANLPAIEIIVVNDGSTDKTGEVVRNLEKLYPFVRGVHNETNKGMGAAFLEGVSLAKYDRVTIFPGDNNTTPHSMEALFKHADDAEMVLSYFLNTEARGVFRHTVSTIFCTIYVLSFGIHLKYTHGSVIYPVEKIRKISLRSRGYSLLVELNMKLLRQGVTYIEVPGYMYPTELRSGAIRPKVLLDVIFTYISLVYEVYFKHREKYSVKANRVMPKFE